MERVRQNPRDAEFAADPYAFYDRIRAMGGFVFWEDYDLPVATNHATVSAVLKDRRFGREPLVPVLVPEHLKDFYDVEAHSMLELEPPTHTRLRGNVLRAFTSSRIQALAPSISELADRLVEDFPANKTFDLLAAYAEPLPLTVITRLLGMPEDMAYEMRRWSNLMVKMYMANRTPQDEQAANTAAAEFAAFVGDYVKLRRSSPSDDLISALIATESEGEQLTTQELVSTVILLMNAGHEATVHAIGNGVATLLGQGVNPDSLKPTFIAATVEEILRFDPPLHMFTRYAYEDCEIDGYRFARGDMVGCLLAAANRDPKVFPAPSQFDPTRPNNRHVSFGAGIHFCVGAPLARLEMQVGLPILFARCPKLSLATAPEVSNTYHFHGLKELLVQCGDDIKEEAMSST